MELDSQSNKAPTSSRSIYLQEIPSHLQIDHNEILQRRLAHSTKLFRNAGSIATAAWAKATLLHLRWFVPSPLLWPLPLFHSSIGGKSLQQVPLPPSAAYAACQDYEA